MSPPQLTSFASYNLGAVVALGKAHCDNKQTKVYSMHCRLLEFNASWTTTMQIFITIDGNLGGNKNSHKLFKSTVSEWHYKQKAPISHQRMEHSVQINPLCIHRGDAFVKSPSKQTNSSLYPDKELYIREALKSNSPRLSRGATNPNHEQQSSSRCSQLCLQHTWQPAGQGKEQEVRTGTCTHTEMSTHTDVCTHVHQNKKLAGKNHIREQKAPQKASVKLILGNTEWQAERPSLTERSPPCRRQTPTRPGGAPRRAGSGTARRSGSGGGTASLIAGTGHPVAPPRPSALGAGHGTAGAAPPVPSRLSPARVVSLRSWLAALARG